MRQPGQGLEVLDRLVDRAVETELVEQRRPELGDERPDVAELAAEQLAQEAAAPCRASCGVRCRGPARCTRPGRSHCASAWAGPSWISWASRDRSASWASTIRIWRSPLGRRAAGLVDQGRVATLEEEPRSLERPLGELQLGQLGLVLAELARSAGRRRRARLRVRASSAPASAALGRAIGVGRALGDRGERVSRRAVDAHRARRAGPASGRAPRSRPGDTARGRSAACSRCSRRPRSPPPGGRRSGCHRTAVPGVLAPSTSEYRGRLHGQTISKTRTSASGIGRRRPGPAPRSSSRKQSASGRRRSRTAGQRAVVVAHDDDERVPGEARVAGEVQDVARRSRRAGPGPGRRWVSASQIGKLVMTGPADASSGCPMAAIRAPSSSYMRGRSRASRPRTPAAARPRTGASRRSRAARRARRPAASSRSRTPEPSDPGIERQQRGHDEQHVDRTGGVQERAPGRRDREDQAGDQERDER